ncbi:MAG: hypothetical protein KZQ93_01015 [Candidatus Thiodiazotropha sp. (ex Monitilora ramsayi)]|nr:hypothetical protein [Candidatus Thiodiazotropha sp. (ex Monitilora ramsayi)]
MILRRLYLLVPGRSHADAVVRDLMAERISRKHIHTIAKPGVDIEGLPEATLRQRSDFGAKVERWFWDMNLLVFFAALALLLIALWLGAWLWVVGAAIVAVTNVVLGYLFAGHVPKTHVEDCLTPLRHGEILLLVDVPRWRITQIERNIRQSHPEVEIGGVGWGLDALGI